MRRREFLAAVVAASLPVETVSAAPLRTRYHRFNRAATRWDEIRFEQIATGDELWIDRPNQSEVVKVYRGYCSEGDDFLVSRWIDKKTNTWVDKRPE